MFSHVLHDLKVESDSAEEAVTQRGGVGRQVESELHLVKAALVDHDVRVSPLTLVGNIVMWDELLTDWLTD